MRGKRDHPRGHRVLGRLIPAHAGKTGTSPGAETPGRAHPRSCGENSRMRSNTCPLAGSSPLMRGKQDFGSYPLWEWGLIPAHAGKTSSRSTRRSSTTAHPRSCGENHRMKSVAASLMGSSPLMRGKRVDPGRAAMGHGLIPAHAGKTVVGGDHSVLLRAHPRSCGENSMPLIEGRLRWGSSPLMRGKLPHCSSSSPSTGLIPAHAGKTPAPRTRTGHPWAHPRSCGENEIARAEDVNANGSSPLMRGKPGHPRVRRGG